MPYYDPNGRGPQRWRATRSATPSHPAIPAVGAMAPATQQAAMQQPREPVDVTTSPRPPQPRGIAHPPPGGGSPPGPPSTPPAPPGLTAPQVARVDDWAQRRGVNASDFYGMVPTDSWDAIESAMDTRGRQNQHVRDLAGQYNANPDDFYGAVPTDSWGAIEQQMLANGMRLPSGTRADQIRPGTDMRNATITPTASSAATAATARTGRAADQLERNDIWSDTMARADALGARYRPTAVPFTSVGTDAAYTSGQRDVQRRAVDPNVNFQGVGQRVDYASPGANVTADRVDTDVSRRAVNPRAAFTSVGTDVGYQTPGSDVGFNRLDTTIAMGERIRPEDSQDLLRFRGMRQGAAEDIAVGADRGAIARNRLAAFDAMESPDIRDQIRAVGQRAAALGRTGMGQTEIETLQPFTDYLTRRAGLERDLAADTAAGEIDDRYRELEAARGLVGEEEELGAGRRSELRGERSFETAVNESNIGRNIGERNTSLGVSERNLERAREDAQSGIGLAERNLARRASERDAGLSADERNIARDLGLASEEAALTERNLGRRGGERDFAAGLATDNLERVRDDARFGTGLEERNVGRASSERDALLALLERNRGRDLGLAGEDAALDERNVERLMDDRRFMTGVDESNIERRMGEAERRTGFDERMGARSDDARRAAFDDAFRVGTADEASDLSRVGAFSDVERDIYGREEGQREEFRGERDYQQILERMALEDAIRQQQMETGEEDRRWNQDIAEDTLEAGMNPAGVYLGAAGQYGGQSGAGYSAAGDLLMQWMARQRRQGATN